MTPAAAWILVALAAGLVGAAVPALLQLRKTLRTAEATLESTGRRVDQALDRLTTTLERVDRATDELERGVHRASSLWEALAGIGDAIGRVRSSAGTLASIGASLGTVLGGVILAAFGRGAPERDGEPDRDEPRERKEQAR